VRCPPRRHHPVIGPFAPRVEGGLEARDLALPPGATGGPPPAGWQRGPHQTCARGQGCGGPPRRHHPVIGPFAPRVEGGLDARDLPLPPGATCEPPPAGWQHGPHQSCGRGQGCGGRPRLRPSQPPPAALHFTQVAEAVACIRACPAKAGARFAGSPRPHPVDEPEAHNPGGASRDAIGAWPLPLWPGRSDPMHWHRLKFGQTRGDSRAAEGPDQAFDGDEGIWARATRLGHQIGVLTQTRPDEESGNGAGALSRKDANGCSWAAHRHPK